MSSDTFSLLRAGKPAGSTRIDLYFGLTEFPREIFALADSLEVPVFGRLLGDLLDRCREKSPDLRALRTRCESSKPRARSSEDGVAGLIFSAPRRERHLLPLAKPEKSRHSPARPPPGPTPSCL